MNLRKAIIVMLLNCLLVSIVPMTAFANPVESYTDANQMVMINPRLTYIDDAQTSLSINNGKATVDCWVNGDIFTATKTKVIAELQVKSGSNWIAYGTWTKTENSFKASVYETKSVKSGQTYRVKGTYTVWEGSQSETIIVFSDEMTA